MNEKRKIEVVPYNPAWPDMFEKEAARIHQALGDNCINVHHIGSTSVPGLAAKPIIDMIPVVRDILQVDQVEREIQTLGYTARREAGMLFRRFFYKDNMPRTHNVHIFEQGNAEIERHLMFRDWMRTHADDRQKYQELKQQLAEKFKYDIDSYCFGKDHFVAGIDTKTGFNGFRIVMALTQYEWNVYHRLIGRPTQKGDHHFHFVLYKGTKIVCAAYMEFLKDELAIIRSLATDDTDMRHDYDPYMKQQLKKWLNQKRRKLVSHL